MIRLDTLGTTDLKADVDRELAHVLSQPKRLGLLVYLAVEAPDGFVRRDTLLALFWPEFEQAQARQALRSALYFLRQYLGDDALANRGAEEVGTKSSVLECDVSTFRRAASRGDLEAALAIYRGDFLAGLHIPESSPDLDQWLSATRATLRRQAAALAWSLSERAERNDDMLQAVSWARRAHDIESVDEASLRRLMELLDHSGDTGGALRAFDEFAIRLRAEVGVSPSETTTALVDRLRARRQTPSRWTPEPRLATAPSSLPPVPVHAVEATERAIRSAPGRRRFGVRPILAGLGLLAGVLFVAAVIERQSSRGAAAPLRGPVVVSILRNETGDTSLAVWGRYAGDWITQGLQSVDRLVVVPWSSARRAATVADSVAASGRADVVAVLARETGAGSVITGSYYRLNDSLQFRVEVVDALTGRVVLDIPPIAVARDSGEAAVRELRDRLMGGVGLETNPHLSASPFYAHQASRFEAFVLSERADELFRQMNYDDAAVEFERAFAVDSTFLTPVLSAAIAHWNQSRYSTTDSLLSILERRRGALNEYQRLRLDELRATLRGDGRTTLDILRREAALGPSLTTSYNLALRAIFLNRPHEALRALESLDSAAVSVHGWAPYWTYLAHANHLAGRHERELAAVRELRKRFPERTVGLVLEVCAYAALGRIGAIDSVLAVDISPPNTYWSTGAALVSAGEELKAHGHADDAGAYFERGIAWLTTRLRDAPRNRYHREWLETAYYQQGEWDAASRVAVGLMAEFPRRLRYRSLVAMLTARRGDIAGAIRLLGDAQVPEMGSHLVGRARIAAIAGDADGAASFLAEALSHGISEFQWDHADFYKDFEAVLGDPRIRHMLLDTLDQ